MERLWRQYEIDVQIPTNLRKARATAAISLEPEEITLVQRPMSHTPTTARYYQAVTGILHKHKKYKVFSDVTVTYHDRISLSDKYMHQVGKVYYMSGSRS